MEVISRQEAPAGEGSERAEGARAGSSKRVEAKTTSDPEAELL